MTTYPAPVYVGKFAPVKATDVVDLYIDIAADLVDGETVSSCAFTVKDSDGATVTGVVGAHSDSGTRTDFRITAPSTTGAYELTAVFTISDGQQITRIANLRVV